MGLLEYELHCAGCRYNLRHQPLEGKCPECGSEVRESLEFLRGLRGGFLGKFLWGLRLSVWVEGGCAVVLSITGILYAQLGFSLMFDRPWVWVPVCATGVLMGLQLVGMAATWLMTGAREVGTPMGNVRSLDDVDVRATKTSLRALAIVGMGVGSLIGVGAIFLYLSDLDGNDLRLMIGGLSFLQLLTDGIELVAVVVSVRFLVRMAKDFRAEWLIVPTVVVFGVGLLVSLVGTVATLDNFLLALDGTRLVRRRTFYVLYWVNRMGEVMVCGASVFLWVRWRRELEWWRGVGEAQGDEGELPTDGEGRKLEGGGEHVAPGNDEGLLAKDE